MELKAGDELLSHRHYNIENLLLLISWEQGEFLKAKLGTTLGTTKTSVTAFIYPTFTPAYPNFTSGRGRTEHLVIITVST